MHHMQCRCQSFQPGVKNQELARVSCFVVVRNPDLACFLVSNILIENGAGVNKMTNITYAQVCSVNRGKGKVFSQIRLCAQL